VWSRSTLELERTLTGHSSTVYALVFERVRLISASWHDFMRVWDVATGQCEGQLDEGASCLPLQALAVSGRWLLSANTNLWEMKGEPSTRRCERTLASRARCFVAWDGLVASGSENGDIQVWDSRRGSWSRRCQGIWPFCAQSQGAGGDSSLPPTMARGRSGCGRQRRERACAR
jgi:WD40 repeat protein